MKIPVLQTFLALYILSLGFTDVLSLDGIMGRIQIPELVFLPLFGVWCVSIIQKKISFPGWNKIYIRIALLVAAFSTSAILAANDKSYSELLTLLYLVVVFTVFSSSIQYIRNGEKWIENSLIACGLLVALSGITGWLLERFGISNRMCMPAEIYYPYLGHVGRATGWMDSPNMYHNLLGVTFLFFMNSVLSKNKWNSVNTLLFFILLTGLILSFAKTILFLAIGALYLLYRYARISRMVFYTVPTLLFIFCMIGSHFLFIHREDMRWESRDEKTYFADEPVMRIGDYDVMLTNYSVNKISAIKAGIEHPWFGVGPGGHNAYVGSLKTRGEYPAAFINFDPHSTYTGTFGETGIFGLMSLILLIIGIYRMLQAIQNHNTYLSAALISCFLFMALDGIVLDVINFRHLWILIAITAAAFTSIYFPNNLRTSRPLANISNPSTMANPT